MWKFRYLIVWVFSIGGLKRFWGSLQMLMKLFCKQCKMFRIRLVVMQHQPKVGEILDCPKYNQETCYWETKHHPNNHYVQTKQNTLKAVNNNFPSKTTLPSQQKTKISFWRIMELDSKNETWAKKVVMSIEIAMILKFNNKLPESKVGSNKKKGRSRKKSSIWKRRNKIWRGKFKRNLNKGISRRAIWGMKRI